MPSVPRWWPCATIVRYVRHLLHRALRLAVQMELVGRHAYATMPFLAGEHPKVVSERLGHSSVALTLDTYTHYVEGLGGEATVQGLIRRTAGAPSADRASDGHAR